MSASRTSVVQLIEDQSMGTANSKEPKAIARHSPSNSHPHSASEVPPADFPFAERVDEPPSLAGHAAKDEKMGINLIERGKDVLSGEAGGVAAAVAIGVGAALIEVELLPGLIIGAGAILLGKMFPELGGYVRPAVKGAVRAGFALTEKAREIMAEANEQVHDLVAEVKHEREQPLVATPVKAPKRAEPAGDGALPVH
jgi:hypothetical protein